MLFDQIDDYGVGDSLTLIAELSHLGSITCDLEPFAPHRFDLLKFFRYQVRNENSIESKGFSEVPGHSSFPSEFQPQQSNQILKLDFLRVLLRLLRVNLLENCFKNVTQIVVIDYSVR